MHNEALKRLDRWATGQAEHPFLGIEDSQGLKNWTQTMKEQAAYCSEALQMAMQRCERLTEPITKNMLKAWYVDDVADNALRMAIMSRTGGTAKQFIMNNRADHPEWLGLEHWRVLIGQFDPINTRLAQEERADVMKGATSKKMGRV